MTSAPAYDEIRRRALELVESRRIDPVLERDMARALVTGAVEEYQRRAHLGQGRALHNPTEMIDRVLRAVSELGPLTELLGRSDIEEVFIEGGRVSFLDNTGRLRALDEPSSEPENRQVVERLLAETDRRLDASSPIVQARVLDGAARLTAVIPPIADQLSATIRRYALRRETLTSLVELGSLTRAAAGFLAVAMRTTASFLVSGPPGAGKTSLLAALIQAVPPAQCIRSCEEVRELHVPMLHGSYYESRPPALDGKGEVSLRDLVKVVLAIITGFRRYMLVTRVPTRIRDVLSAIAARVMLASNVSCRDGRVHSRRRRSTGCRIRLLRRGPIVLSAEEAGDADTGRCRNGSSSASAARGERGGPCWPLSTPCCATLRVIRGLCDRGISTPRRTCTSGSYRQTPTLRCHRGV